MKIFLLLPLCRTFDPTSRNTKKNSTHKKWRLPLAEDSRKRVSPKSIADMSLGGPETDAKEKSAHAVKVFRCTQ